MAGPFKIFDPTTDVKPGQSNSGVVHTCDLCGRRGRWDDDWSFYGSIADQDAGIVLKTCGCARPSEKEATALLAKKRRRHGRPGKVCRDVEGSW